MPLSSQKTIQCTDGQFIKIDFAFSKELKNLPLLGQELINISEITIENFGYTGARRIVLACTNFLKYTNFVNKHRPENNKYTSFNEVDSALLRAWYMDMLKKNNANFAWRYFCSLRSGVKRYHEIDNQFPLPPFPSIKKPENKKTEPLDKTPTNDLIEILKREIDRIHKKIKFVEHVNKHGKVIDIDPSKFEPKNKYSQLNIAATWHNFKTKSKWGKIQNISRHIDKHNELASNPIIKEEFINELLDNKWIVESKKGTPISKVNISNENINIEDALTTMHLFGYPLKISFKDATESHAVNKYPEIFKKVEKDKFDILKTKILMSKGSDIPSTQELINCYYPTAKDQSVILIFLMLQTGWNKEMVLSLDWNNFENKLSKSIDSETVLLESSKRRGQHQEDSLHINEKKIIAISSKNDRYSAYNLIKLSYKLSNIVKPVPTDINTSINIESEELFLCLVPLNNWKTSGRVYSLLSNKAQVRGIELFLTDNKIYSQGKRLTSRDDLLKTLRPTWLKTKKKDSRMATSASYLMGHSNRETTDIYYDSSSTATHERRNKLAREIEKISKLLKTYGFKGKLHIGPSRNIKNKSYIIFSDPRKDRPILICQNNKKPDWQGHNKYLLNNEKCFQVNKCLFCSQCMITKDSLPYLIDREAFINNQERTMSRIEFITVYGDEFNIINHIIETWPDSDDIQEAEEFWQENAPLLPSDIKLLIPYLLEFHNNDYL